VLIPKPGQPGKFRPLGIPTVRDREFRPLGIPTVRDRVVQAAVKNVLEPVFEADFYPVSHGFRPGKRAHGALEQLRLLMRPKDRGKQSERRLPHQWAIEGAIKGCLDSLDRSKLVEMLRNRVADESFIRLVGKCLHVGVLDGCEFTRPDQGAQAGPRG
jgi:retron-type reverse transcriptase